MQIKELKNITSKGYEEAFLSNKYIFRHISVYISYIFLQFGISANTATFFSLILAIIGAFLQAFKSETLLLISCAFLFLYYLLDMVDGEIARFNIIKGNREPNPAGPYFDALVHYIFTPILFLAIGLYSYHEYGHEIYIWAGLLVGMWLSSYPQAAAHRVVLDLLLGGSQENNSSVKDIWKNNKIDRKEASLKEKFRFLIRELFSSQGQIFTLTALVILELFFEPTISLRTLYLLTMAFFALINIPRVSILFFRKLKNV